MTLSLHQLRFARERFALGPLDLELPRGKRSVLLGPSGCGKTTLLRLIAGLEEPSHGKISFGDEVFSAPDRWLTPHKRGIALLFQNLALWPHMKAWQQVDYAGRCGKSAAIALLERVGIKGLEERLPGELSGGEGQRVSLARALAQKPRILLLDEPLRSVDPHLREELQELFLEISRKERLTMVFVTHDREEALALGEEIILMDAGQVIERGPAETLFQRPRTAFAARFLQGASLLSMQAGQTALGSVDIPSDQNGADLYAVLGPLDIEIAEDGHECEVLSLRPSAFGLLGEVRIEGELLRFRIREGTEPGTQVRLRLIGKPHVVNGEGRR